MAGFLYFAAGVPKVTIANVDQLTGLGYAFAGKLTSNEVTANNPSGKAGWLFADSSLLPDGETLGIYVDRQTWRKMPTADGPELWLGYWNDHPPQPDELRRDTRLSTHGVKLDDGRMWHVPIVGHREEKRFASDLPAFLDIDEHGNRVRGKELPEYSGLWEVVADLADRHFAAEMGEGEEPSDGDQWAATVALLQAEYRVGPVELVTMNAFLEKSDRFALVWMIAAAYPLLTEALNSATQKKSNSAEGGDGGNTSAGEAA